MNRAEEPESTVDFEELLSNSRREIYTPYGLQDGNGIDLTLVYHNFRLSPGERLRRSDALGRATLALREHVRTTA
ncbi:MAG TPA: hypothetical protein VF669_21825 [Tepidisphaeraceae bacterium]|jgi:hypothetical protein